MSIRHGLLALLAKGPRYGYQLRSEFEAVTGSTWPLNVGQVYATLARLERDGLAIRIDLDGEPVGGGGRSFYRITPAGVTEVGHWFVTPLGRAERARDELAVKLALAVTSPGVDVHGILEAQRTATLQSLAELTRQKGEADGRSDPAWRLVLESMTLQAEAELRWLDHCEEYVGSAISPA